MSRQKSTKQSTTHGIPRLSLFREDIQRGYRELYGRHPCSLCRANPDLPPFHHFHGSDFGKCLREVQYDRLTKEKASFDDEKAVFLADGHIHEAAIVAALEQMGYSLKGRATPKNPSGDEFIVEQAVPGTKETILIVGHTDGIINDKYLLEVKAVKDWSWKNKFVGRKEIPKNYWGQMQAYMGLLELEAGVLVVKNRHDGDLLVRRVDPDPSFFLGRAKDLHNLVKFTESEEWVPCDYKTKQRFCRACEVLKR